MYHITARGNERQNIFLGDEDPARFLAVLGDVVERFGWVCHAKGVRSGPAMQH